MSFTSLKISNNHVGFGRLQSKGATIFFLTTFGIEFYFGNSVVIYTLYALRNGKSVAHYPLSLQ